MTNVSTSDQSENTVSIPVPGAYHQRVAMGGLAIALPFALLLLDCIATNVFYSESPESGLFRTSVSAYHYSGARILLSGVLAIIGFYLLAYRGHPDGLISDDWLTTWGGIGALGVAAFPTEIECDPPLELYSWVIDSCGSWPEVSAFTQFWTGYAHFVFAVLFFGSAAVMFRRFLKDREEGDSVSEAKLWRNAVYRRCFQVMIGSLAITIALLIAEYFSLPPVFSKAGGVFWGEVLAVWAFGIAWLVSSKAPPLQRAPVTRRLYVSPEAE